VAIANANQTLPAVPSEAEEPELALVPAGRKREDDDEPDDNEPSGGSAPRDDPPPPEEPPPAYKLPPQINNTIVQEFLEKLMIRPQGPPPNIYTPKEAEPAPQPNHIVQQFFENLLKAPQAPSIYKNPTSEAAHSQSSGKTKEFFDDVRRGLERVNSSNAPVSSIGKKSDAEEHIPVMLFTALTLPNPPDVGIVPVVFPNGKLDWLVMSADWQRFDFSSEELAKGTFNLEEHLGEFIPKSGSPISIITSQNGINVKLDEFVENCKSDNAKIASAMVNKAPRDCPELPLYVGIYNPTHGLIQDLDRVFQEKKFDPTDVLDN
jgi:hypothetical protein